MKNTQIRRLIYLVRHKYFTANTAVIVVAFLIAIGFVWGSLGVMQRNYTLQAKVDQHKKELELIKLEAQSLEFENRYYQTDEYKELAVRERLGLARNGEHALILPPNTMPEEVGAQQQIRPVAANGSVQASNVQQWLNFLFGGAHQNLQ